MRRYPQSVNSWDEIFPRTYTFLDTEKDEIWFVKWKRKKDSIRYDLTVIFRITMIVGLIINSSVKKDPAFPKTNTFITRLSFIQQLAQTQCFVYIMV